MEIGEILGREWKMGARGWSGDRGNIGKGVENGSKRGNGDRGKIGKGVENGSKRVEWR